MADSIKVLGQAKNPTSETDLYTVPVTTATVPVESFTTISTLVICNRTTGALTFRASIAVDGGATDDKDYFFYDAPIAANTTITATLGMTMSGADVMRINGSATGLSFNLFGVETR